MIGHFIPRLLKVKSWQYTFLAVVNIPIIVSHYGFKGIYWITLRIKGIDFCWSKDNWGHHTRGWETTWYLFFLLENDLNRSICLSFEGGLTWLNCRLRLVEFFIVGNPRAGKNFRQLLCRNLSRIVYTTWDLVGIHRDHQCITWCR